MVVIFGNAKELMIIDFELFLNAMQLFQLWSEKIR